MPVKRASWRRSGNAGTDSATQFIGTIDGEDFVVRTNNTERLRFFEVDPVNGGPAADFRGLDTMFMSQFLLFGTTGNQELVMTESGIATQLRWKLNNPDEDVALRIWQIFSEDPGFAALTLTLGNDGTGVPPLSNHSYSWTGAGVDFDWTPPSINEETNFNSVVNILPGAITYPTGAATFEMLKVGGDLNAIDNAAAQTSLISTASLVNHTVQFTNFFSSTNALNLSFIMSPSGLGAGSDTHSLRGIIGSAFYNGAGAGRTMLAAQGAFFQCGAQTSGTVTTATGFVAQAGLSLGTPTVTNANSIVAGAPFKFLSSGTIGAGTSLTVTGGTLATTNFALKVTNAAVPSFIEGNTHIGGTTAEADKFRVTGSSRFEGDWGFSVAPTATQTGYTTFANLSTDRTLDANSTTVDEIADVLGTLVEDLKTKGIISA